MNASSAVLIRSDYQLDDEPDNRLIISFENVSLYLLARISDRSRNVCKYLDEWIDVFSPEPQLWNVLFHEIDCLLSISRNREAETLSLSLLPDARSFGLDFCVWRKIDSSLTCMEELELRGESQAVLEAREVNLVLSKNFQSC